MKIKRITSLLIAVLLMFSFSFNTFAILGKQDPNHPEEGISFVDSANEDGISITIDKLIEYWNNHGILTIVIILILCLVIAISFYSYKKKKHKKSKSK